MASKEVECSGTDGVVNVTVTRKHASSFPAEVSWSTEDETALHGTNYMVNEGTVATNSSQ